jgi:Right handed beta helix region
MTRTIVLLGLIITALASIPAYAQPTRVFVSGHGLDTNPCTVTQPCRTFQVAYNTAAANGEIDVLDPAGYGPLSITHGISVQAHGFGGTTFTTPGAAINISVTTSDPVTLNGLIIDGAGTGDIGIYIASGPSVQILNSVVRHFSLGIYDLRTTMANLLIEDTVASDNVSNGIEIATNTQATLNRITANNNEFGVRTKGLINTTIANSVLSNNNTGLQCDPGCATWLAKTVISGNAFGVFLAGGTVSSYGDNYINDNTTPVSGGSLTPVAMQ